MATKKTQVANTKLNAMVAALQALNAAQSTANNAIQALNEARVGLFNSMIDFMRECAETGATLGEVQKVWAQLDKPMQQAIKCAKGTFGDTNFVLKEVVVFKGEKIFFAKECKENAAQMLSSITNPFLNKVVTLVETEIVKPEPNADKQFQSKFEALQKNVTWILNNKSTNESSDVNARVDLYIKLKNLVEQVEATLPSRSETETATATETKPEAVAA